MSTAIEGKLAAHDKHQFELKLGYNLNPSLLHNNYKIELYFFIPKSLGVNRNTYSKRYFYSDIQGYIRFKTPTFTFAELTNPFNAKSPLTRIKHLLETTQDKKALISELKLFACTLRVALRDSVAPLRKKIRRSNTAGVDEETKVLCSGITRCLSELRGLNISSVPEDVRRVWRYTDEYLGIVVDDFLNSLNNTIINSSINESLKRELIEIISPIILSEYKYRTSKEYVTYSKDSENELFLYRKGLLKKLITSILFLETHTQEGFTYLQDLLFAVAAGIAMILATVVTVWASIRWGTTSIPFVVAIVLGYMVKDRIKDWLKLIFSKQMTRWFADFKINILDPEANEKIGISRQAFSFISEKSVPDDIRRMRQYGHNYSNDFWLPEEVIKYEKDIILNTGPIIRAHSRLGDITDIVRFNVHRFLDKMDDPYEIHRAYDTETGETVDYKCARVYHVNLILKLAGQLHRIRLVMNQNGLKRVEEVK